MAYSAYMLEDHNIYGLLTKCEVKMVVVSLLKQLAQGPAIYAYR